MTDILEIIKKFQEMYGDDVITTADKINRPDPKPIVKDIEAINEFVRRNPQADGGRIPFEKAGSVKPYADRLRHLTVPKGYVSPKQLAEELGVTESTLKKYRTKGVTVDKYPLKGFIDKTFKPIKKGLYVYYLKPTEKMLENYNNFKNRTTISRDLLNDVKKLHKSKLIKNLVKSKNKTLPTLEEVVEVLGKDVKSHGRAANAMATLSKMYSGEEYRLLKLPKNEETGKFIFKALRKGGKFNPYKAAFYNLAIEEIDKTLGNETGTLKNFKRYFKDNLNKYLGKGHGVSLNEVASISGMVSNDMAPYGAFVDLTNSKINKGLLANFQGTLTNALTEIDKLKGREKVEAIKAFNKTHIPNFKKQIAAKYGNELANSIRFTEIVPGTRLTDTYKAKDLAKYKTQGINLKSLAKKKGYYLDVKGARPYTEFLEKGKFTKLDDKKMLNFLEKNLSSKQQQLIKNQFCPGNKNGLTPGSCPINEAMDNMVRQTNAVKQGTVKGAEAARIANKASKVARFGTGKGLAKVLGPYGLAAEALFEVAFAVPGYARGETGKRLLGDSIFGLIPGVGQSAEEEFAEYATKAGMSELEQQKIKDANRFLELNQSLIDAEKAGVLEGRGVGRGAQNRGLQNYMKLAKEYNPLYDQFVGAPPSQDVSAVLAEQDRINQLIQADQAERAEKRNIALEEDFMAAEGGIASGPPPTGGPMSQGLRSLYNNGRKL